VFSYQYYWKDLRPLLRRPLDPRALGLERYRRSLSCQEPRPLWQLLGFLHSRSTGVSFPYQLWVVQEPFRETVTWLCLRLWQSWMQRRVAFPRLWVHCWQWWDHNGILVCLFNQQWDLWLPIWSHRAFSGSIWLCEHHLGRWRRAKAGYLHLWPSLHCLSSHRRLQAIWIWNIHLRGLWDVSWGCEPCSASCGFWSWLWVGHGLLDREEFLECPLGGQRVFQDPERSQHVCHLPVQLLP